MAKSLKMPRGARSSRPAEASADASLRTAVGPASPTAMTPEQLGHLLQIPPETIYKHLAEGAPADNGRINIIHYAAWLLRQVEQKKH